MITETLTVIPLLFSTPSMWSRSTLSLVPFSGEATFSTLKAPEEEAAEATVSVIGQPRAATFLRVGSEKIDPLAKRDVAYRKLVSEIVRYRALAAAENDDDQRAWDASAAIDKAVSFLDAIPLGIPLPRPMLLSEQVALYWDFSNVYAEIDFDGTDYIDAYGKRSGKSEVNLNRLRIADRAGHVFFPTQLERIISSSLDAAIT